MPSRAVGITVREAMKLEALGAAVILGGRAGLDRVITNVTVLETDDAPRLLTGNELLVSSFYATHNDVNAALRWLNELSGRGCAGVIVCYVGRYYKGDVEALARRADELELPLITIPNNEDVLYSDIINAVLAELLHRQTRRLEYALSVHNRLSQEALMGADPQTLISSLSKLLHSTVIMADPDLSIVATHAFGAEGQVLLNRLLIGGYWRPEIQAVVVDPTGPSLLERLRAVVGEPWFDVSVQPIQVEHAAAGHLMAFKCGEAIDEIHEYALKVGVTVIALERMRAGSVRETERRLQGDFLDDVVHWLVKSPEMIMSRAQALGLDLQDKRVVMVVSIDDAGVAGAAESGSAANAAPCREEVYRLVQGVVRRQSQRNMVVSRGSRLMVLLDVEADQLSSSSIKEQAIALGRLVLKEFSVSLARGLCRCSFTNGDGMGAKQAPCGVQLSIGIGSTSRNFTGLHQSYADALQAIEVGRRLFGSGHVMHIDDVSLYSILDFVAERKEARQMVDEVLGPLRAYDAINGTDLLKTLEMICLSGEGSSEVARKLYIHRNTLAYRQTRIKEVLGFDPFSGQGRIRLDVALMLDKLIQADRIKK